MYPQLFRSFGNGLCWWHETMAAGSVGRCHWLAACRRSWLTTASVGFAKRQRRRHDKTHVIGAIDVAQRFKRVTFAFPDHLVDLFISRCQFAWLLQLLRNSTAWRACVARPHIAHHYSRHFLSRALASVTPPPFVAGAVPDSRAPRCQLLASSGGTVPDRLAV